jgi:2-dehydropantoate 2-reductase
MAVTIVGAGAIGGVTGASLARAGHDVLLVDQAADHVRAINAGGLTVVTPDREWTVAVRAATPEEMPVSLDLVLLAVKAQHTETALDRIAPRLHARGTVVSVQNGLNEALIAARVGSARTVGCLVNWSADWIAPGRIQHGGPGAFAVGELDGELSPRVKELAELLSAVTPTQVTGNIWGCKWSKHVFAALLVATAVVDAHVYEVVERSPEIQRMLVFLVAEGMAVAEAEGVQLEAFDEFDPAWYRRGRAGDRASVAQAMAAITTFYRGLTKTKTGIWRDIVVRKRKTEVEAHFGATLARAERHGLPAPLTRRLLAMIGEIETGRRPMTWDNLDELAQLVGARP